MEAVAHVLLRLLLGVARKENVHLAKGQEKPYEVVVGLLEELAG